MEGDGVNELAKMLEEYNERLIDLAQAQMLEELDRGEKRVFFNVGYSISLLGYGISLYSGLGYSIVA